MGQHQYLEGSRRQVALPHPLDPYAEWAPKPVELAIRKAASVAEDDVCLNACPENRRGFANTAIYHCQH